ncbi:MAG: hypothetical protein ACLUKN_00850 [Bacilli bacterium]
MLSLLPHFLFAASRYYVAETGNDSNDGLSWRDCIRLGVQGDRRAAAAATEESPSEYGWQQALTSTARQWR